MNWPELWPLLKQGSLETLQMVLPAALIAEALGLTLGVLLTLTRPGGLSRPGSASFCDPARVISAARPRTLP